MKTNLTHYSKRQCSARVNVCICVQITKMIHTHTLINTHLNTRTHDTSTVYGFRSVIEPSWGHAPQLCVRSYWSSSLCWSGAAMLATLKAAERLLLSSCGHRYHLKLNWKAQSSKFIRAELACKSTFSHPSLLRVNSCCPGPHERCWSLTWRLILE